VAEMIINQFPAIASAISQPLSKTEKIVIVDNGGATGGQGGGAAKVTGYVTDLLAKLPETVQALTGADLTQLVKRIAADPAASASAAEAAAGAAAPTAEKSSD